MDGDRLIFNRLFIAAPHISFKGISWLDELRKRGVITREEQEQINTIRRTMERANRTRKKAEGKGLIEQLLVVAPDVFSSSTVDFMRKFDLVSVEEASKLRLIIRAAKLIGPAPVSANKETVIRLARLGDVLLSYDMIDLMRERGDIDVEGANVLRAHVAAIEVGKGARKAAMRRKDRSLIGAVFAIAPELLSKTTIRALLLTGVIDRNTANILNRIVDYGPTAWKAFEGAKREKGFAQRMLMVSQAIFSQELVDILQEAGIIDRSTANALRPAITASRNASRRLIDREQGKGRKYRVIAGEAPIKTYARTSRDHDKDILKLLAQAAAESRKEAEKLASKEGIGAATRRAQYLIQAAELHRTMRDLWEGIGYLTIIGERDTAEAAVEAMEFLDQRIYKRMGTQAAEDLRKMTLAQARGGVDHFISRQENVLHLSRLVYRNMDLWQGRVDNIINLGLLQGQGAREIAKKVEGTIRPTVPGGVSYAAMRLARTELNNAFHNTTIRETRDKPWVTGYKWHLSDSHPHRDECNIYAEDDHNGLGRGVFKKSSVPSSKPHPNCLCYITPVLMSEDRFRKGFREGRFNKYWKEAAAGGVFGDPGAIEVSMPA